jgi:hypothetical protein
MKPSKEHKCRHQWYIGAGIGAIINHEIRKIGLFICCNKCRKHIKVFDRKYLK